MADVAFDVSAFRVQFTQFANVTTYPDAALQAFWDAAVCYISPEISGGAILQGSCQVRALNLMTAHLAALSAQVAAGQVPGIVTASAIDKVSVSIATPPVKNQWQWWLSLTGYGQQLLALLQVKSVGGMYIGGLPETLAFRRVGGIFK